MGGFHHLAQAASWLLDQGGRPEISLAARLSLAGLFATAGVYKLRRPLVAAEAAVNFGVIRRPHRLFAYALAGSELLTAALLVSWLPVTALAGCVLAAMLSLGFVAVTATALRVGRRFPCGCLPSEMGEISAVTLARAIALTFASTIGALALLRGVGSPHPMSEMGLIGVALAFVAVGLPTASYFAISIWRTHVRYIDRLDWYSILRSHRALDGATVQTTKGAVS